MRKIRPNTTLANLPKFSDDLIDHTLRFMGWRELLATQTSNKKLLASTSTPYWDQQLWQQHFDRCFPEGTDYRLEQQANESYRALFKRSYLALLKIIRENSGEFDDISDEVENLSEALKNDRKIILVAVTLDSYSLKHASAALQNDKDIVLAAVNQDGYSLEYASEELKNNKAFVLAAIAKSASAFDYASETLQADNDIIKAKETYGIVQFFSELQNDKEIVLAAVTQNGLALQYATAALQNDREIVFTAITQDGGALQYASDTLQADWALRLSTISSLFYPAVKYPGATKSILRGLAVAVIALAAVLTAGLSLPISVSIVAGAAVTGGLTFFAKHRAKQAEVEVADSAATFAAGPQ